MSAKAAELSGRAPSELKGEKWNLTQRITL
jgi:hypothetical protein